MKSDVVIKGSDPTILQVTVKEWTDFDTLGKQVSFAVRLPHDVWLQSLTLSSLEYEGLLDRCWEVIKKRVIEHYGDKSRVAP